MSKTDVHLSNNNNLNKFTSTTWLEDRGYFRLPCFGSLSDYQSKYKLMIDLGQNRPANQQYPKVVFQQLMMMATQLHVADSPPVLKELL
jgi:hypothetical protein